MPHSVGSSKNSRGVKVRFLEIPNAGWIRKSHRIRNGKTGGAGESAALGTRDIRDRQARNVSFRAISRQCRIEAAPQQKATAPSTGTFSYATVSRCRVSTKMEFDLAGAGRLYELGSPCRAT